MREQPKQTSGHTGFGNGVVVLCDSLFHSEIEHLHIGSLASRVAVGGGEGSLDFSRRCVVWETKGGADDLVSDGSRLQDGFFALAVGFLDDENVGDTERETVELKSVKIME